MQIDFRKRIGTYIDIPTPPSSHKELTDKEINGIIDHADSSVYPAKLTFYENINIPEARRLKNIAIYLTNPKEIDARTWIQTSGTKTIHTNRIELTVNTNVIQYIYFDLPFDVTKAYISANVEVNNSSCIIGLGFTHDSSSGSTNTWYVPWIEFAQTNQDFNIARMVSGFITRVATENVDLPINTRYRLEGYCEVNGIKKACRDNVFRLQTNETHPSLTRIRGIQIWFANPSYGYTARVYPPIIVLTE